MKYCWKTTGFDADANKVGKELENINLKEKLTREVVLKYAKNKESELHKCFEWDDSVASEKYRLFQASCILSSISIVIDDAKPKRKTTRMYVNIKNTIQNEREYKSIVEVLENDEEYKQLVGKAEQDFLSYKQKYEELIQINDLKNIIYKNL